jgi:NDP-sugar pyrophosphorylase family protein
MGKRAIILAGGKGTRLKPYTISLPKPLVPIGDIPILEVIIRQLKLSGFDYITITVNHMADIIQAFFGDGSKWGIQIDYSFEKKALSTMGPLTLIKNLPDHFLVMNGDVLTNLSFSFFYDHHVQNAHSFTVASYKRTDKVEYGVLTSNENGELVKFDEKPAKDYLVSMGVYMMSKSNIEYIPFDTFFGFDHLMNKLIAEKKYPKIYQFDGYWLDIGRPADYERAIEEFDKMKFFEER